MLFSGLTLVDIIARAVALLIAISIHEAAHAWMAYRLGDTTARAMGRLTLNPLAHLDPLGTLMLLTAGFGWGKPVPVNPYNLRNGPKSGMAVTSLAGPASNLLLALVFAIPLRLGLVPFSWGSSALLPSASYLLLTIVLMNIALAIFNLIPVAPLDGFKIVLGVLPYRYAVQFAQLERYGPMILLGLFALGWLTPIDPFGMIMRPFFNLFISLFLGF